MPIPYDLSHPSPSEVIDIAVTYAELLRSLFHHPQFKYLEPPTTAGCKIDFESTPRALFFAMDFVQNTYVKHVIPFLPAGATLKCKIIANPWAFADPDYPWEWEWDAATGSLKGADGEAVEFPRFSQAKAKEMLGDLFGRNFLAKKAILENGTDPKATLMMGGPFDFGEEVKELTKKLD
ncbi:hypothetical protein J7T55_004587 [Diaporthe amygdali]|uniref:uncharacterized protein n=1 Tax=Phomopsis amygdali TaxID=1214568 RepID=UPI0022FDFDB7|nr:uncharacterized protein J7T55_004587 [Diaporthe amygdali]KAJ0114845.1 hypothetical protein J7T55_004587 [Diaporthe amygdali]